MKFCTHCHTGTDFARPRDSWCRKCKNELARRNYERKKLDPAWVEKERERNRLKMRKKRADAAFKEVERAAGREHKKRKWREPGFKEAFRARRREKYNTKPSFRDAMRARNNQWNKTERGVLCRKRRTSRERESPATLTADEWAQILKDQCNACACCGIVFEGVTPEADHILPVSKGGALTKENTQALCKPCNASKGDKYIDYRRTLADNYELV